MTVKKRVCMICGKSSEESICKSCKDKVQGEAAHKKQKIERQVKVGEKMEKKRLKEDVEKNSSEGEED